MLLRRTSSYPKTLAVMTTTRHSQEGYIVAHNVGGTLNEGRSLVLSDTANQTNNVSSLSNNQLPPIRATDI